MWFYNHSPNQLRFALAGSGHLVPVNSWIWFPDECAQLIHNRGLPLREEWWFSQEEPPSLGTVIVGFPPVPEDTDEYDFYRQMIEGQTLQADSPGHRYYLTQLPTLSREQRIPVVGQVTTRLRKAKPKLKIAHP